MVRGRSGSGGISGSFGGNINIWLNGSKKATDKELEVAMEKLGEQVPESVYLIVVDEGAMSEEDKVGLHVMLQRFRVALFKTLPLDEFSSGAVGYKYRLADERFIAPEIL